MAEMLKHINTRQLRERTSLRNDEITREFKE